MGESKQLLDIRGEKLLGRTVRTVAQSQINDIVVVLGAFQDAHRLVLRDFQIDVIFNKHWEKGMGSSIKAGLEHLIKKHSDLEAVIIFVCDQPLLSEEIIAGIIAKYRESGKPIIACTYADTPGVPVLFHSSYFNQLLLLPDHQGAKKLILDNLLEVGEVPFRGGAIDLDTMCTIKRPPGFPSGLLSLKSKIVTP
jgi:molybdenum cofactor cytidylyltransferase